MQLHGEKPLIRSCGLLMRQPVQLSVGFRCSNTRRNRFTVGFPRLHGPGQSLLSSRGQLRRVLQVMSMDVTSQTADVLDHLEMGKLSAAVDETESVVGAKTTAVAAMSNQCSSRLSESESETCVECDLETGGLPAAPKAATMTSTEMNASKPRQHSAKMKIVSDEDFEAIRLKLFMSGDWRSTVAELDTVCIQAESTGRTLLHCFTRYNRELSLHLLAEGVPADAKSTNGDHALMEATGDLDLCKQLSDHGADVNFRLDYGFYTNLMGCALLQGHFDFVDWLVHHPNYHPDWGSCEFKTLREKVPQLVAPYLKLFMVETSALNQRQERIEKLNNALLNSVRRAELIECKALCDCGADINFRGESDNCSLLETALQYDNHDIADWLIHDPNFIPLWKDQVFITLRKRKPDLVVPYLDRCKEVSHMRQRLETQVKPRDAFLSKALMDAARSGDLVECKLLCDYGADINIGPDFSGWDTLDTALYYGHYDIVELLLHHPQYAPQWKFSIFTELRRKKPELVVPYLKLFAVDESQATSLALQTQSQQKRTDLSNVLIDAAWRGDLAECKLLCDYGADVNHVGPSGSKVMLAAPSEEVVDWLIHHPKYSPQWDNNNFKTLCNQKPQLVMPYLDLFAEELPPHSYDDLIQESDMPVTEFSSRLGVKYKCLEKIYGDPEDDVADTALAAVVNSPVACEALACQVIRHIIKAKWMAFGKMMFRQEVFLYTSLVVAFSTSIISEQATSTAWNEFHDRQQQVVGISRIIAAVLSAMLLIRVERREALVEGAAYFLSFWNLLGAGTYVGIIVTVAYQACGANSELLQVATGILNITLWINMYQYFQMTERFAVLVTMMSYMMGDVSKFILLYSMFLFGFSGGFYVILNGSDGYKTFVDSLISVLLMLFGQTKYDPFQAAEGLTWVVANLLLLVYLVSVVIVLLNLLIAMMSTSYGSVWDQAEGQVLLSYAQTIIRMERSISKADRRKQIERLKNDVGHLATAAREVDGKARKMGRLQELRKEMPGRLASVSPFRRLVGWVLYLVICIMLFVKWLCRESPQSSQKSLDLRANAITKCSTLVDGDRWEVVQKKTTDDYQTELCARVDKLTLLMETLVKEPLTEKDQQVVTNNSRVDKLTMLVERLVDDSVTTKDELAAMNARVEKLTSLVERLLGDSVMSSP